MIAPGGLHGRARALSRIMGLRRRAADGVGGVVLVAGEAGMGKTTLCDAVLVDAKRDGWQVAWAAAAQASALPGLWPWRQLLGTLDGGDLPGAPSNVGDPAAERVAQFDAVARRVRNAAMAAPVLAVLDDAHWTDPATLAMLVHFAATARQGRACLLVTYRPEDAPPSSPLGAILPELRRLGTEVALDPLARDDVRALAAELGSGQLDDPDVDVLVERTQGNPLFVTETVRLLDGRPPRALDALRVPPAIRATIAERVSRLPAGCRDLLGLASAIGGDFNVSTLADVADHDVPTALGLLEEAVDAAIVEERGLGWFAFRHPLFRASLYEHLGVASRAAAHARIAMAVEAEPAADPEVLAHHFGLSAPLGNAAIAARYAVAAGDAAMARLAYETAARHYGQALGLSPNSVDRVDVLLRRADADAAAGRESSAWAGYEQAAEHAVAAGRTADLARAALGRSGGAGMEVPADEPSRILLGRAIAVVGDATPALQARMLARLSVVVAATAPPEQRAGLVAEAVALAEASEDPLALADSAVARCHLHAGPDGVDQRLDDAATVIRHATACRQTRLELLGRRLRIEALFERGALSEAERAVDEYARRAMLVRDPRYTYFGHLWRATLATDDAAYRRERTALDEVLAALPADSDGRLLARVQELFHLLDVEGDATAALRCYRQAVEAVGVGRGGLPPAIAITQALVLAAAGRAEEVLGLLTRWDPEIRAMSRDAEWIPAIVQLADVARYAGEHPLARWAQQALQPYRDLWAVEGIGAALRGPVSRALAALGDVLDEPPRDHAPRSGAPARLTFDAGTWLVDFGGVARRVKASKGMRDIAALVAHPGVAVAALDLVAEGGEVVVQHALGPMLDDRARTAYRRRVAELDAVLDAADSAGDTGRSASLAAERDRIVAELSAAVGMGGRVRPIGSSAERARTTVTTRVKDALRRLDTAHPEAARHLRRSLRTGTSCSYDPDLVVAWEVSPPPS